MSDWGKQRLMEMLIEKQMKDCDRTEKLFKKLLKRYVELREKENELDEGKVMFMVNFGIKDGRIKKLLTGNESISKMIEIVFKGD